MRKLSRIVQIVVVSLCACAVAQAQSNWAGTYEFTEDGGRNAGGSAIIITHVLTVIDGGDELTATLQSNGYQTSSDLVCTAKVEGARLLVRFQNYGEDNMFEPYQPGDLLLTLEKKKGAIITHWGKFTPSVPKNEKSGKVYFELAKKSKS